MTLQILLLDLQNDPELIAQYEAWHKPGRVPEAVIRSIHSSGIESMEIYRSGNRLVMVLQVGDDFDPAAKEAADADDPAVQAWETRMNKFQQSLPWAAPGQKWVPADRIFSLNEQRTSTR